MLVFDVLQVCFMGRCLGVIKDSDKTSDLLVIYSTSLDKTVLRFTLHILSICLFDLE